MSNYRIEAFYTTGDSESSYDTSTVLSPVWTDLAKAKKALQTLREHHDFCKKEDDRRWYRGPITDEQLKNIESIPWYRRVYGNWSLSIFLEGDEDSSKIVSEIPYHGYFERLKSLKIIVEAPEESGMELFL